jgi:hypothetical protein
VLAKGAMLYQLAIPGVSCGKKIIVLGLRDRYVGAGVVGWQKQVRMRGVGVQSSRLGADALCGK